MYSHMKPLFSLLVACAIAMPLACRSSAPAADLPCNCGTSEADMQGCLNSTCASGERNSDNPDCVCGSLRIPR